MAPSHLHLGLRRHNLLVLSHLGSPCMCRYCRIYLAFSSSHVFSSRGREVVCLLLRKRSTQRALFIAKSTSSLFSAFLPREDLLLSSFRTDDFFVAHAPLVSRLPADSPLCHRRHRRRLLGGGAISNERASPFQARTTMCGRRRHLGAHSAPSRRRCSQNNPRVIYDGRNRRRCSRLFMMFSKFRWL